MSGLTVYGHWVSQPSRAVLWVLKMKGLPFTFKKKEPFKGDCDKEDYLAKFPTGDPGYSPAGQDVTDLDQLRDDLYELKNGFVFYDVTGNPDPSESDYNANYGNRLASKIPVTDALQVWKTANVIYDKTADIIGFNWSFETPFKQLMG